MLQPDTIAASSHRIDMVLVYVLMIYITVIISCHIKLFMKKSVLMCRINKNMENRSQLTVTTVPEVVENSPNKQKKNLNASILKIIYVNANNKGY